MQKFYFQLVRFLGIGFLNTALDFAVLNLLASSLGIYKGLGIGLINGVSFTAAVLHSYFWNKSWAFGGLHKKEGWFRNIWQFGAAAFLGAAIVASAIFGAGQKLNPVYFLFLLAILAVGETALWKGFKLGKGPAAQKSAKELLLFIVVSVVGLLINSGVVAGGTAVLPPQFGLNQELWSNLIKAGATAIALIWNFLGYKLVVFKR